MIGERLAGRGVVTHSGLPPLDPVLQDLLVAQGGPAHSVAVTGDELHLEHGPWPPLRPHYIMDHLAVVHRRPGVPSQLYRRSALAQTVGGLAGVVSEVLLAHAGDGEVVLPPLLTGLISPVEVQPHAVLVPDHLRCGLGVNDTGEVSSVAGPALHQVADSVDCNKQFWVKFRKKSLFSSSNL